MRTGLFSILQIKPTPVRQPVAARHHRGRSEEQRGRLFRWVWNVAGRNCRSVISRPRYLWHGRPLSTSIEISQRGYKGEIAYEDPFFLETDLDFKARVGAYTFDFDGYSKFETGGRIELSRKITKQYEVAVFSRSDTSKVTSASIDKMFLGQTVYFANSLWFQPDARFS